jgi:hypothetical protein
MTSITILGNCSNPISLGEREYGEALLKTIVVLSTLSFGFYAQEHLGVICRQTMEIGKIHTGVSAVGGTRVYGKGSSKSSSMSRTLNG